MIPHYAHRYFWDVDPLQLDLERDHRFIIERLLEKGNDESVRWLQSQYTEEDLKKVVASSNRLSPKSRNYWGLTLHLWSTSNQSVVKPAKIWQH